MCSYAKGEAVINGIQKWNRKHAQDHVIMDKEHFNGVHGSTIWKSLILTCTTPLVPSSSNLIGKRSARFHYIYTPTRMHSEAYSKSEIASQKKNLYHENFFS